MANAVSIHRCRPCWFGVALWHTFFHVRPTVLITDRPVLGQKRPVYFLTGTIVDLRHRPLKVRIITSAATATQGEFCRRYRIVSIRWVIRHHALQPHASRRSGRRAAPGPGEGGNTRTNPDLAADSSRGLRRPGRGPASEPGPGDDARRWQSPTGGLSVEQLPRPGGAGEPAGMDGPAAGVRGAGAFGGWTSREGEVQIAP